MSSEHPCRSYSMTTACLGGFAPSSSPSLEASMDEDDDGGDDKDASFSNYDEITTFW